MRLFQDSPIYRFPVLFTLIGVMLITPACNRQNTPEEQASAQPEQATPEATTGAKSSPAAASPKSATVSPRAAKQPPMPKSITLPAGTAMVVRTTTALSTKNLKPGDPFVAHLAEPLAEGERVVAPKGARVDGVVSEADEGGRVKGRAYISVELTQLHLDSGPVEIRTSSVGREARSTKKKDAAKIGIGAGIGAAIGAIAGGGKGAAIGAAVGGGAGTGAVVATRGDAAVIPAETVLKFQLTAPVTVR